MQRTIKVTKKVTTQLTDKAVVTKPFSTFASKEPGMNKRIDLSTLYAQHLSSINAHIQKFGLPAEDVVHLLLHGEIPLQVPGLRRLGPKQLKRGDPQEALLRAHFFETAALELLKQMQALAPDGTRKTAKKLASVGEKQLKILNAGRPKGTEKVKANAAVVHKKIRQRAEELWIVNSSLSQMDCAKRIAGEDVAKKSNGEYYAAEYIRDILRGKKRNPKSRKTNSNTRV